MIRIRKPLLSRITVPMNLKCQSHPCITFNEGRSIHSTLHTTPTSHHQGIGVIEGFLLLHLLFIITTTLEWNVTELDGFQLWQIWLVSSSNGSLSNTTDWHPESASHPTWKDDNRGRSVESIPPANQTSQSKRLQRLKTVIAHYDRHQEGEILQGKEVIIHERTFSDINGFEFRTVADSEATKHGTVASGIDHAGVNERVVSYSQWLQNA